uniref:PI3K-RBD domain-containing protein n=1 Tax=Plectus sambesii TaxID=2011161 RepID=A0A914WVA7_9BILA
MSSTVNDRRVPPERPATPTELTNIRLAVELSKQTYAEEEERRKSVMSGVQPLQRSTSSDPMCCPAKMPPVIDDLIDWTDPAQKEHEEKVAFIKRLYEMDSLSPSNLSPAVAEASATVYGPPTRGISVPCFPSFPAFALSPPAVVPRSATAFPIATTPAPVGPPPALSLNYQRKTPQQQGAEVRWRSSSLAATPTGGMGSNYPLMVPFRPTSIRLGNGDLIDLGPPAETPGEPATWDNLKYEFDPLYSSPRSAEVVQIRQEYQKADESAFLNKRPPVKPPRLSLAERERSASALQVSSTSLSAAMRQVELYTLDDVHLIDVTSDLALQLALLQSRLRPPTEWGASLFISPTVDYALPGASSVMLVVHKDHSWPTSSERDSLSFTCAVSSTVEQILESVLTTFFPNENDLPTVDYGLKVYGLDEYLAPHSVIGHYAFLRQALAFGDDIRLQVGRLPRPSTMRKSTISDLDHSRLIAAIDKRGVIAGVEKSSIQLILETLRGELKRALGDSASHGRNGVKQSVKALCQLFNRVQPHDLVQALRSFESAATN